MVVRVSDVMLCRRMKEWVRRGYRLIVSEDNLDKSLRQDRNKTIVHHFVSVFVAPMNTSDTPNVHFGDTPFFALDETDIAIFIPTSKSSVADLRRMAAEDLRSCVEV